MFLDLDLPEAPKSSGLVGRLFGRKSSADAGDGGALERLRAWVAAEPSRHARVYRTRAGYRYLVTHDVYDPLGAPAHDAMAVLGVDEKYRALCRVQQSFRARLTPKPWRVGLVAPKERWPFETPEEAAAMAAWLESYARASADHAVCELIEETGSGVVHAEVAPVLALHDEMTKVGSALPLA
jgi:hypothetical protein